MITVLEWTITAAGLVSLALVVLKAMGNEQTQLIRFLQAVNLVAIKVGAVCIIALLGYVTYRNSNGVLTIKNIGFYLACGSILYSLMKDVRIKTEFIENISTVVSHKAQQMQQSISEQAAQAKKSRSAPSSEQDTKPSE